MKLFGENFWQLSPVCLWLAMAATPSQPLFIHQKLPLDEQAPPDYNDDAENKVDTNEQYKGRLREKNL